MKIKIYEDRKVYIDKTVLGVNNENKVEKLEFEYPQQYKDFTKILEMKNGEWKAIDEIVDDEYEIKNNVTSHQYVSMQVVFKDEAKNIIFKSEMFEVQFLDAINATDEIEEENKDVIQTLVDEKFEAVEHEFDDKYVEKEEGKGLSENDFTDEYKQDVDDNTNARHTHSNKSVLDNISSTDINNWNNKSNFSGSYNDLTDKPTIPSTLAGLTDDSTHRVVTDVEKTAWNAKYDKPNGGIPKTDLASDVQTSLGKADTALQQHQDITGKEDKSNKTTAITDKSTDIQYPSAKAVYDALAGAGGVDYIFQWDGESSTTNPDNLVLWQQIYEKQKERAVIVLNDKTNDVLVIPKNRFINSNYNQNFNGLYRDINNINNISDSQYQTKYSYYTIRLSNNEVVYIDQMSTITNASRLLFSN